MPMIRTDLQMSPDRMINAEVGPGRASQEALS